MAKPSAAEKQYALVSADTDPDEQEQLSILYASLKSTQHYFGEFANLFHPVHDPAYLIKFLRVRSVKC